MSFFFIIFLITVGFIIQDFLNKLLALVTGSFYRSYFLKALKVYIFSTFVADMILLYLRSENLIWAIIQILLISVWVWLFYSLTNYKLQRIAVDSGNETASLSHSREATSSYLYLALIPVLCFFPNFSFFFLHNFFYWVSSGINFVLQWSYSYTILSIIGLLCFFIINPILQPFFAILISFFIPRKNK